MLSADKIKALAKSSGWLKRKRKFTGMDLLKTMVFIGQRKYQFSLTERFKLSTKSHQH